jgi:phage terminase large subunit-like protein
VLTWCAANAVIVEDDAGNRKLSKRRATGRLDLVLAGIMALGISARGDQETSIDDFLANPVFA